MELQILLNLILIFILPLPGIIIAGINEKKGAPMKAIIVFTQPSGNKVQTQIDAANWSWTVYLFRGWALLFRGQFMEFLILFLAGILLETPGLALLLTAATGVGTSVAMELTLGIILICMYSAITSYYVAYANRNRLRMLIARGYNVTLTPNLGELYKFLGIIQPVGQQELKPNQRAGESHTYVVPEKQEEEEEDYSTLTVHDLKLLLKSEGVPFNSSATKKQLLELVDEHIKKK